MVPQRMALVVDDEYVARETMCRLVNWADFGFAPPATACNGKEALELYERQSFDLVFTDIEMPIMNGIQLIEQIRRRSPQQSIAIISCHEKFEYAYQAVKLGVDDYFIKDLITKKELTAFLSAHTQKNIVTPIVSTQQQPLQQLLELAVQGAPLPHPVPPFSQAAAVLTLAVDPPTAHHQLENLLGKVGCAAHCIDKKDVAYLVFEVPDNSSTLYYYNHVTALANTVRSTAKGEKIKSLSIGVSNLCTQPQQLTAACEQALQAVQMRMLIGPDRTTIYDTIALRRSALDFRQIEYTLTCIKEMSLHANTACLRLIDQLYAVQLPSSFADIHYYRFVNTSLWSLLLTAAKQQGREHPLIMEAIGLDAQALALLHNSKDMAKWIKAYLIHLFSQQSDPQSDSLVNRALSLIEQQYHQDISLEYIARTLHTNKSYLARLFKERTGETVMNYILYKKIKRAKYLLLYSQLKLYEISDQLGFASPQYFSTTFKRLTGSTPNEYKKSGPLPGAQQETSPTFSKLT